MKAHNMRLLSESEIVCELLVALHWSEDLRRHYNRVLRDHERAGSPPVPIDSTDYRKTWRKKCAAQLRGTSGSSSTMHSSTRSSRSPGSRNGRSARTTGRRKGAGAVADAQSIQPEGRDA